MRTLKKQGGRFGTGPLELRFSLELTAAYFIGAASREPKMSDRLKR